MAIHIPSIKYERYPAEKLLKLIQSKIEEIKLAKSADELIEIRKEILTNINDFATASAISYVRFTQNTKDKFFLAEKEYYDNNMPILTNSLTEVIKEINKLPFVDEFYKKLPESLRPIHNCNLKACDERIIEDMQKEANVITEYSKLMSEISFDFRGEKMPLSLLRKYMEDKDRETRKEAYESLGKTLEANSQQLDEIFDRLVKIRDTMAKKLGYKNYIELGYYQMNRICYNRDDVENLRQNILSDVVPVVSKIRTERAKKIGISEMKLYDYNTMFGPKEGDPEPNISAEQIFEAGKQMYHEMNPNTAKFIDQMLETEAFDYQSRDGKWGGGYEIDFPKYKQQFILANFNGTSADVDVLTHEAGHAFASYMCFKNNVDDEISMGGMETAETHSMSMEFFCWKWIDKFFGDRAKDYKFKHLMDSLTFLTYGIIVDAFQHVVYEHPELTPAQRDAEWLKLEKQFRPYMNADGITYLEKGTRWQYQMHIYERPFYYIDYVIAQTAAIQFLLESQKDYDDAFKRYYTLLGKGGESFYTNLLKEAGLKTPFEKGALSDVAKGAEKLLLELET